MEQLQARASGKIGRILSALGKFGGYRHQPLHEARKQAVESSPVLEAMKKAWAECGHSHYSASSNYFHAEMLGKIKDLKYSAKDIEDFSIALVESQNEEGFSDKSGLFLSALINNCNDGEFVIHTSHLTKIVNNLGFRNTKDITVDGDAGENTGCEMKSGTITIRGNSGNSVGAYMKGGAITVEGNADMHVGYYMEGGEIHIFGDIFGISADIHGGKIFHKEERVFPV